MDVFFEMGGGFVCVVIMSLSLRLMRDEIAVGDYVSFAIKLTYCEGKNTVKGHCYLSLRGHDVEGSDSGVLRIWHRKFEAWMREGQIWMLRSMKVVNMKVEKGDVDIRLKGPSATWCTAIENVSNVKDMQRFFSPVSGGRAVVN